MEMQLRDISSLKNDSPIKLACCSYIAGDPVCHYLSLKKPSTQMTMYRSLNVFAQWLYNSPKATPLDIQWAKVTFTYIQSFIQHLQDDSVKENGDGLSTPTILLYLSAIKRVIACSTSMEFTLPDKLISDSLVRKMAAFSGPKHVPIAKGRVIPDLEVKQIEHLYANDVISATDYMVFIFSINTGVRVAELVSLNYPNSFNKVLTHVVVTGKGNKERMIPLNSYIKGQLVQYLDEHRGRHTGPLFHRKNRNANLIKDTRLSTNGVRYMYKRLATLIGSEPIKTHNLRKTFGTKLIQRGVDLFNVQKIMGHSDPATLRMYDLRETDELHQAVELLI